METLILSIRLILFGVFAVSSVTKFMDREGTKEAVREFGVPESMAAPAAIGLPAVEIAVAAGLLFLSTSWIAAAAAFALLAAFTCGMAWQLRQGRAPDCHCFGQLHSEPVGRKSLIRNAVFLVLAGTLIARGQNGQGADILASSLGTAPTVAGLFLLVVAVVILGYLSKLASRQNDIIRRLSLLEMAPGGGAAVQRNDAGDPHDGLPIGAPLPDLAIPDLNGRIVRFEHMMGDGKPFLFLFVGAECSPCEQLMPEIHDWEQDLDDRLHFVLVSHGDLETNRQKFGGVKGSVLLESGREFANSVNAKWTPSALFVDAGGNIASHLAAGDVAIRRLIEQIKLKDLTEKFVYFLGMTGQKRPDIGREIPDFQTKDLNGTELTKSALLGRRTLAAFTSTTCGHCKRLIDEIRAWEANDNGGGPQLLVFSDGTEEEARAFGLRSPLIVDPHYKLAAGFGMRGVPSAVLIDESGIIVTEAAIGPENIWSLIGQRSASGADRQNRAT